MKLSPAWSRLLFVVFLPALVVAGLSAGRPSQAAPQLLVNVKLSGPMPSGGAVTEQWFYVSDDGQYAVYNADATVLGRYDTYSVRTDGQSEPVNLSHVTGNAHDWPSNRITPDSTRVVISMSVDGVGPYELYSVPITGGPLVKLNGPLVAGGNVGQYVISDDSAWVIYLADQVVDEVYELFSVPVAGGTAVKLNVPLPAGGEVNMRFDTDGSSSRVVYQAGQPLGIGASDLYSVPIAGGASVKLSGPLVAGGTVWGFSVNPNATRVVYSAEQDTDGVREIFSVPLTGGTPVRLNPPLAAGRGPAGSQISPDGTRVIYWSDQATDGVLELFSVPIGGGTSVKLNGPLVEGSDVGTALISDDSAWVVYEANQDEFGNFNLTSVPIAGGTAVKLNGQVLSPIVSFDISPDSARVVYHAAEGTPGLAELYSVPIAGGTVTTLNAPLASNSRSVESFAISPLSDVVIYAADHAADELYELFSVPIGGGAVRRVSGPMVEDGSVVGAGMFSRVFRITPDGGKVVYLATQEDAERAELFASFDGVPSNMLFLPAVAGSE